MFAFENIGSAIVHTTLKLGIGRHVEFDTFFFLKNRERISIWQTMRSSLYKNLALPQLIVCLDSIWIWYNISNEIFACWCALFLFTNTILSCVVVVSLFNLGSSSRTYWLLSLWTTETTNWADVIIILIDTFFFFQIIYILIQYIKYTILYIYTITCNEDIEDVYIRPNVWVYNCDIYRILCCDDIWCVRNKMNLWTSNT